MLIYLDTCCFCRAFDDQRQHRILLEKIAIAMIIERIEDGEFQFVASKILLFETERNQNLFAQKSILKFLEKTPLIDLNSDVIQLAHDIEQINIAPIDALHLACAIYAKADVFLTVDDGLLKKADSIRGACGLSVENPVIWMQKSFGGER